MIDLLAKPPDQVTAKDIEALVVMQIQEGAQIEFKENLSTRNGSPDAWMQGDNKIGDYARNTILKEAVAFANAYGGTLLLGIKESKANPPVASQITPLPRCGELAERLRKQFRDCVDRRSQSWKSLVSRPTKTKEWLWFLWDVPAWRPIGLSPLEPVPFAARTELRR